MLNPDAISLMAWAGLHRVAQQHREGGGEEAFLDGGGWNKGDCGSGGGGTSGRGLCQTTQHHPMLPGSKKPHENNWGFTRAKMKHTLRRYTLPKWDLQLSPELHWMQPRQCGLAVPALFRIGLPLCSWNKKSFAPQLLSLMAIKEQFKITESSAWPSGVQGTEWQIPSNFFSHLFLTRDKCQIYGKEMNDSLLWVMHIYVILTYFKSL